MVKDSCKKKKRNKKSENSNTHIDAFLEFATLPRHRDEWSKHITIERLIQLSCMVRGDPRINAEYYTPGCWYLLGQ